MRRVRYLEIAGVLGNASQTQHRQNNHNQPYQVDNVSHVFVLSLFRS